MLGAIGLDAAQEAAYRALAGLGSAALPELAHRLDLPDAESLETLRALEKHGLAEEAPDRPGHWLAVPPAAALNSLLARRREELERAERAAARLAEAYGTATARTPGPAARGTASGPGGRSGAGRSDDGAAPAGTADGGSPGVPAGPDGPDATDLRMLSLLLDGLTDASVAKQLDLGLRTVQRRVRRLMELAGVSTRMQLGWHARDRGWPARSPAAGSRQQGGAATTGTGPAPEHEERAD
ncbi:MULTISPECIES: LuxR family transcriptional regulator [unclassified Streptomyces]|uniref:helix-turn-helix transcriptional regulator n=1 Tax=unclassified Streptomyces TaxID=2593676 RepID=UPI00211D1C20|nr:LuxR family transcriptional regulator [Streptomyces sp. Ru87]